MSIVAGYTRLTDDENIPLGTYNSVGAAEDAIEAHTSDDVATYWLASFIHDDTGLPEIFAFIDP
jgi:hypothetical protein